MRAGAIGVCRCPALAIHGTRGHTASRVGGEADVGLPDWRRRRRRRSARAPHIRRVVDAPPHRADAHRTFVVCLHGCVTVQPICALTRAFHRLQRGRTAPPSSTCGAPGVASHRVECARRTRAGCFPSEARWHPLRAHRACKVAPAAPRTSRSCRAHWRTSRRRRSLSTGRCLKTSTLTRTDCCTVRCCRSRRPRAPPTRRYAHVRRNFSAAPLRLHAAEEVSAALRLNSVDITAAEMSVFLATMSGGAQGAEWVCGLGQSTRARSTALHVEPPAVHTGYRCPPTRVLQALASRLNPLRRAYTRCLCNTGTSNVAATEHVCPFRSCGRAWAWRLQPSLTIACVLCSREISAVHSRRPGASHSARSLCFRRPRPGDPKN